MLTFVLFSVGFVLLYFGGEGLVRSAAAIGVRLRLSPRVVGLTLVAFATSAPELAISVDAALKDLPGLAVGNVVGSNICNLALIFGLVAMVKPAGVRQAIVRRDVIVMSAASIVVPALLWNSMLERAEGIVLIFGIVVYTARTVWHSRSGKDTDSQDSSVPVISDSLMINLLLGAGSLTMLTYGSTLFVDASVIIAAAIGVPPAIVGLSAAALGSSLPELTASIISARHGHPEMAAGNLIGSNIFNLLLILGVTSAIRPLSRASVDIVDLAMMLFVTALALLIMLGRDKVKRSDGAALVTIYCGYMIWLYYSH